MTIKEVSEKYGISQDALRYYERVNVIPKVTRTSEMCIRDSDKANATLTQDFHNLTDFQIVTTHAAHVLDAQILHIPGFHFFHHC